MWNFWKTKKIGGKLSRHRNELNMSKQNVLCAKARNVKSETVRMHVVAMSTCRVEDIVCESSVNWIGLVTLRRRCYIKYEAAIRWFNVFPHFLFDIRLATQWHKITDTNADHMFHLACLITSFIMHHLCWILNGCYGGISTTAIRISQNRKSFCVRINRYLQSMRECQSEKVLPRMINNFYTKSI